MALSKLDNVDNFFEFQITDLNGYHEYDGDNETYHIQLFGRTADDKTVCIKVNDYQPFFYVSIPYYWDEGHIEQFVTHLKKNVKYRFENNAKKLFDYSDGLVEYKRIKRHKFKEFDNEKWHAFLELKFSNYNSFREYSSVLSYPMKLFFLEDNDWHKCKEFMDAEKKGFLYFERYEANIEPHLRFLHLADISPCGWLKLDKNKLKKLKKYSYCDYVYEINFEDVKASTRSDMAPLKILGYDIECISSDHGMPQAQRKKDKTIQIGMSLYRYGSMKCEAKWLHTLKKCDPIEGATVCCYETEAELLIGFAKCIREIQPDIMTGYNIFGFDDEYIYSRAKMLGIKREFLNYHTKLYPRFYDLIARPGDDQKKDKTRHEKQVSLTYYEVKNLSSSALGDNILKHICSPGIVKVDMLKAIQRDHKLDGYKLDNTSAHFIRESVIKTVIVEERSKSKLIKIYTKSTKALEPESYIQLIVDDGLSPSPMVEDAKYLVREIGSETEKNEKGEDVKFGTIIIKLTNEHYEEYQNALKNKFKLHWTFAKDDMHHTVMNHYYREGRSDRIKQIGIYCIKDCILSNLLLAKLEIIANSCGMAEVCCVPLSYLFFRGQGVKATSLVVKYCRSKKYLLPTKKSKKKDIMMGNELDEDDEKYEGARVVSPKRGIYDEDPIGVLDYGSLYPSSMLEGNTSHETYVADPKYLNNKDYTYYERTITKRITYKEKGVVKYRPKLGPDGKPITYTHIFAKKKDGTRGILCQILEMLLDNREKAKGELKVEKDPFRKILLEGRQLAFKLTANSLYGQTGAPTSPLYKKVIAETTTAIGRERLDFAIRMVESNFKDAKIEITEEVIAKYPFMKDFDIKLFEGAEIIYGDTDSIFMKFKLAHIKDHKERLAMAIRLSQQAGFIINDNLPKPQKMAYEKTLYPFILYDRKKYVGILYEYTPEGGKQKHMGIELKRRDNAAIVKIITGGMIHSIIKDRDRKKSLDHAHTVLTKMINGEYPLSKFTTTKALKGSYKYPDRIMHKILADRMKKRDPGNAPQVGDRITYAFIHKSIIGYGNKKIKSGEFIETPEYIKEKGLKLDYVHYIERQLKTPLKKNLSLLLSKSKVDAFFKKYIEMAERVQSGTKTLNGIVKKSNNDNFNIDSIDDIFD